MHAADEHELILLWLLAADGDADAAQLSRLNEWLETSAEARELILAVAGQQGWLAWHASQGRLADALGSLGKDVAGATTDYSSMFGNAPAREAASPDIQGSRRRTSRGPWILLATAACLVGFFTARQLYSVRDDETRRGALDVEATMVSATGCIWGPGNSFQSLTPAHLNSGDALQLLEGIAEFRVGASQNDVRLQMEGPASVVLTANGAASTSYGKIVFKTGRLPAGAYAVETSFGRVLVGPSTEIGLINFGSTAEVHCFRGTAQIESPWVRSNEQDLAASVPLAGGEAVQFQDIGAASLQPQWGAAQKSRFTPQVSMSTDFLAVTPEYVRTVVAAGPVAYWRFEHASDGVIPNEMGPDFAGRIKGQVGWAGPGGNRAIELGLSSQPGSVMANGSWDEVLGGDFSIELWMKPNHHHLGSMVGFVGAFDPALRRNRHGILLETCGTSNPSDWLRVNQLRFLHRSELTADPNDGVSCFTTKSYESRRWQHVVAVREGDKLSLYVDGELVQQAVDNAATPPGLQLVIGQLYTETVERFFIGQLDEVAIYDRALRASDVRLHFQQLRRAGGEEARKRQMQSAGVIHEIAPLGDDRVNGEFDSKFKHRG